MKPERIDILGVPLDCVTMDSAIRRADSCIRRREFLAIFAINPEKVIKCLDNKDFHDLIGGAGLLIPDGIGVVLAARLYGRCDMKRVPGAELMPGLCELAANNGYSIFLYGAAPEVNRRAADVISRRYPGIRIAGRQHGYLEAHEMEAFLNRLRELSPDILFVALGSPKQEQWIMEHMPQTGIRVCQGVGGTLDVISGKVRRAPRIFRSMHLEWLYRLLADPRRLLRQTALPRFARKVLISRLSRQQHNGRSTG